MNNLIKLRYIGTRKQICTMPGYTGELIKGQIIETTKENFEAELKEHSDWELITETIKDNKKKEKLNENKVKAGDEEINKNNEIKESEEL